MEKGPGFGTSLQVMIGSIGEEAAMIRAALPPGHGHVVMDTTLLPSTFRCDLRSPWHDDS